FVFSADERAGFELLDDPLIEPDPGVLSGHGQGVLDRLIARAAMTNDADAVDPEQGRTAVSTVIVAVHQRLEDFLRRGPFRAQAPEQLLAYGLHDEVEDALADFEDNIAHEAIGDDDIARPSVDISTLNVADELIAQRAGVE